MTTMRFRNNHAAFQHSLAIRAHFAPNRARGFTLIELLTVITIIGILAGLSVTIVGLASRKNKEARVKGELTRLIAAIENYKDKMGFYPPDSKKPSTNQLFYELSGTVFNDGKFIVPGRLEGLQGNTIQTAFDVEGFSNSARTKGDLKSEEEFKLSQVKTHKDLGVELLVVPVRGLPTFQTERGPMKLSFTATDGSVANPWLYDSSSTNRNNLNSYDLWAEVVIGKNVIRFSNWEKNPEVIGPAR
jgi:prepilin-type N-terminal cleavage/methylation domain-containing protein